MQNPNADFFLYGASLITFRHSSSLRMATSSGMVASRSRSESRSYIGGEDILMEFIGTGYEVKSGPGEAPVLLSDSAVGPNVTQRSLLRPVYEVNSGP